MNKSEIGFTKTPRWRGLAEYREYREYRECRRLAASLLGGLAFGVGLFAFEIVGATPAFLYFVGLLTHGELLPLY